MADIDMIGLTWGCWLKYGCVGWTGLGNIWGPFGGGCPGKNTGWPYGRQSPSLDGSEGRIQTDESDMTANLDSGVEFMKRTTTTV
jgi:hypothetical protein